MKRLFHAARRLPLAIAFMPVMVAAGETISTPPTPPSWEGVYLGLNVGGSFGHSRDELWYRSGLYGSRPFTTEGFLGGLFAGYNYQYNAMVIGVEADVTASTIESQLAFIGAYGARGELTNAIPWQASLRLRAGYVIDRFMMYASAGVAVAAPETHLSGYNPLIGVLQISGSALRAGPSVGAGVEYRVTDQWRVRVDYRYSGFPSQSVQGQTPVTDVIKNSARVNSFTLGLSYAL